MSTQTGGIDIGNSGSCPFCRVTDDQVVGTSRFGFAIRDAYPITDGHTLIIPNDHVMSIYSMSKEKILDLFEFTIEIRGQLMRQFSPGGFNVAVNDGRAAGQTVGHGHIHVIPRYSGDTPDPRGGVRWVVSKHAKYWSD